ncbi:MAG: ABC transporter ATP-binding protein, partial [Deltaproteobacteria bacterium]|nr:ABC transporter ATP-binding protein [Deltaproteobacteria bacterium]
VSDRLAVMYLGKIAELADSVEIYQTPLHPYTQALLSASPIPDPTLKRDRIILKGDVPSPIDPPHGCSFHTRCLYAEDICSQQEPQLKEVKENHLAACHFAGSVGLH